MRLLLDQGNTNLRWALVTPDDLVISSGIVASGLALEEAFRHIRDEAAAGISSVSVSSVATDVRNREMAEAVITVFGAPPAFLAAKVSVAGLINGYREPERLGCDRWLTMLGARSIRDGSLLVVDAGTALTLDAVSASGQHLGGYIVPGYVMQRHALGLGTARVGVSVDVAGHGWGRDTQSAVSHGILLGLAALIDRSCGELRRGVDETCSVVLTGGDAHIIAPLLSSDYFLDGALIFRGMMVQMSVAG